MRETCDIDVLGTLYRGDLEQKKTKLEGDKTWNE